MKTPRQIPIILISSFLTVILTLLTARQVIAGGPPVPPTPTGLLVSLDEAGQLNIDTLTANDQNEKLIVHLEVTSREIILTTSPDKPNLRVVCRDIACDVSTSGQARLRKAAISGSQFGFAFAKDNDHLTIALPDGGEATNLAMAYDGSSRAMTLDVEGDLKLISVKLAGDLDLNASGTVTIRDSAELPFIAEVGGKLSLQGSHLIDILALSHSDSALISGGDMVLRSRNTIRGDVHYLSGGQVRFEQLDGQPADLLSPYDPIVFANGDVTLGDYTGASLHILAGGSVSLSNVEITGPDTGPNSINPGNASTFNGVDTIASLAGVTLSNGTAGIINGSISPTLDIRAGIDWTTFQGGAPADQVIPPGISPIFNGIATSAAISVTGNITISAPAGQVLLTNQYRPNPGLTGDVTAGDINASTTQPQTAGGSIAIDSRGNITAGNLFTFAEVAGTLVTAGNAGNIGLLAPNGAIVINGDLSAYTRTPANSSGPVGNGGFIAAAAANGIDLNNGAGAVETFAFSNADGTAGDGGVVGLVTANGDLNVGYINTQTFSSGLGGGSAGDAGDVILEANGGAITVDANLPSPFSGYSINASVIGNPPGNGGTVTATANSGINLAADILTNVSGIDGDAGDINLFTASGDITTGDLTAQAASTDTPGNGGAVSLETVAGSITTGDVTSFSDAFVINNDARDGGDILMKAAGDINTGSLENYSEARGAQGDASLGGNITLQANTGSINSDGNLLAYSLSAINNGDSSLAADGGSITLQAGQNVTIAGRLDSYSESQVFNGQGGTAASGGPISITATTGSISTGNLSAYARANENAADGGDISLTAATGIQVNNGTGIINSSTTSNDGSVGNGGDVALNTNSGDLDLESINSSAANTFGSGPAGNGGIINLTTGNGRVQVTGNLFAALDSSASTADTAGKAGDISLAATQGISVSARIRAQGVGTDVDGGDITLTTAQGDIATADVLASSFNGNDSVGNGGNVTLQAFNGGITTGEVSAQADALVIHNDAGDGGNIVLNAFNGDVVSGPLLSFTEARGEFGDTGKAGLVEVIATNGSILIDGDVRADAFSQDNNTNSGNAGDSQGITLQATQDITVNGGLNSFARSSQFDGDPTPTGTAGNAGPVTLAGANISLSYIDARTVAAGAIGEGGTVQITAGQFLRATGNLFGSVSTIDATGLAGSGAITITHGGNGITPFVVGNPATNGTSGTLSTAAAAINPINSFLYSHFETPNIWIISVPLPLSITKTANPDMNAPYRGEITYTVVVSNPIGIDAAGTSVTDTLPAEVDFARWIDQPAGADASGDQITWNGTVPGNGAVTFTFAVTHVGDYLDVFTNTAEFFHPDSGSSGSASAQVSIAGPPVLSISKTASPDTNVTYQGEVAYTVSLNNDGESDADGTIFGDTLPVEVDFARWVQQPAGASVNGDVIDWTGTVTAGETITLTFVVSHVGNYSDVFTNTAEFFHPFTGSFGEASVQVTIEGPPILDITKTVTPTTEVTFQSEVTYTLTLSNSGQSDAANTLLTDTLPVEVDFVQWINQPAGADAGGDQITWNGTVPTGQELPFIFVVRHVGNFDDTVLNTAEYSHATSNDTAEAAFTVEPATVALTMTKTVTPDTDVTYQGEVTYTIVLSNNGTLDADGTLLTDNLPSEVDFARWVEQPTGAGENGDIINWDGSVAADSAVTFTFVASHVGDFGDVVTNQAQFSHPSGNGSAAATFRVEPGQGRDLNPGTIYLPLVQKNFTTFVDLIVEELVVSSTGVTVTVKNVGNATVADAFWVDLYIDPDPPPTQVNQQWQDLGKQGVAWGVTDSLPANASLTLTLGDQYFVPAESNFVPVPPDTPVYAQVDSINFDTSFGNVLESDESNNILGPETSIAGSAGQGVSTKSRGSNGAGQQLPER